MKKYFTLAFICLIIIHISGCSSNKLEMNYALLGKGMCKPGIGEGKFLLKVSYSNLPDSISFIYPIRMNLNLQEEWDIRTGIAYKSIEGQRVQIELIDFHDITNNKIEEMLGSMTKFIFIKIGNKVIKQPLAKFFYNQVIDYIGEEFFRWNNRDILKCDSWSGQVPKNENCSDPIVFSDNLAGIRYEKLKLKLCWK